MLPAKRACLQPLAYHQVHAEGRQRDGRPGPGAHPFAQQDPAQHRRHEGRGAEEEHGIGDGRGLDRVDRPGKGDDEAEAAHAPGTPTLRIAANGLPPEVHQMTASRTGTIPTDRQNRICQTEAASICRRPRPISDQRLPAAKTSTTPRP
jgi:hypothetical protein